MCIVLPAETRYCCLNDIQAGIMEDGEKFYERRAYCGGINCVVLGLCVICCGRKSVRYA